MRAMLNDDQPIFKQIAQMIEDDILDGIYKEGDQIISVAQMVKLLNINPATAVKGVTMLVDENIIVKKRGVGMFVQKGAVKKITDKRKEVFINEHAINIITEAKRIKLGKQDLIEIIETSKEW